MLVKVGFLCERVAAPIDCTYERPLTCVRAQVVKEVVPLPENVLTVFKIALHKLYPPIGLWILKSHHSEASSARHVVLIDSDLADIDLATVLHKDGDSLWNHILQASHLDLARVTCERLEYHFFSRLRILTFFTV